MHQPWYIATGRPHAFNVGLRKRTGIKFKDRSAASSCSRPTPLERFSAIKPGRLRVRQEMNSAREKLKLRIEEVPIKWAHVRGQQVSMVRDRFAWRVAASARASAHSKRRSAPVRGRPERRRDADDDGVGGRKPLVARRRPAAVGRR